MATAEMKRMVFSDGTRAIEFSFHSRLEPWFSRIQAGSGRHVAETEFVEIEQMELRGAAVDGYYDLHCSDGYQVLGLSGRNAVALVSERVRCFLFRLQPNTVCLAAEAVYCNDFLVLIPRHLNRDTGSLLEWFRPLGFVPAAYRLAVLQPGGAAAASSAPGQRGLLGIETGLKLPFVGWELGNPEQDVVAPAGDLAPLSRGLIVVPHYAPGADVYVAPLSAQMVSASLNDHAVNIAAPEAVERFAACMVSVELNYGDTEQLAGVLDVLSSRLMAGSPSYREVEELCATLNARAALVRSRTPRSMSESPPRTQARYPRRITIGMATYDDFDGVYFTIQSMRMSNPWLDTEAEFVVVDNNPSGAHAKCVATLVGALPAGRYIPVSEWSGTAIKERIFEEASSPVIMCVDCHVLVAPGAILRVLELLEQDPSCRDLIQGPMLLDSLDAAAAYLAPEWTAFGFWGTYAFDERANDPNGPAFDIPSMGVGLFACRRDAWPGYHPAFRGYGGEEGYIHEKIRRRGGRTLCWPFLRWLHRQPRPNGVPYALRVEDILRNYLIGFEELGLDTREMLDYYTQQHGEQFVSEVVTAYRREFSNLSAPGLPDK